MVCPAVDSARAVARLPGHNVRGKAMGGKVDRPYKVEVWEGDRVTETLAVAGSVLVAGVAYEAAGKERLGRVVTLRRGARFVRTTKPAKSRRAAAPTLGHLRGGQVSPA